jgi:hypothetical protein
MLRWCLGPESNRYGVASEGFSYSPQLSLPSDGRWGRRPLVWSLDFLFVVSRDGALARVRQGPSSLYTFPRPSIASNGRWA